MPNPNRRELLKYFGIGTIIAPVIGGAARIENVAKLIEVPKVEIIPAEPSRGGDLDLSKVRAVTLVLEMQDGTKRSINSLYGHGARGEGTIREGSAVRIVAAIQASDGWSPVVFNATGMLRIEGALL